MTGTNPMEKPAPVDVMMTVDRIDAMLLALGMPKCEAFTRSMAYISREAQACGAMERKLKMTGLEVEHLRFHMVDGLRVKMLLGERVNALAERLEVVQFDGKLVVVMPGSFLDSHVPSGPAVFARISL